MYSDAISYCEFLSLQGIPTSPVNPSLYHGTANEPASTLVRQLSLLRELSQRGIRKPDAFANRVPKLPNTRRRRPRRPKQPNRPAFQCIPARHHEQAWPSYSPLFVEYRQIHCRLANGRLSRTVSFFQTGLPGHRRRSRSRRSRSRRSPGTARDGERGPPGFQRRRGQIPGNSPNHEGGFSSLPVDFTRR